jgi:hypothetical protein
MSSRSPETTTDFWTKVFRYDFGVFSIVVSVLSWILILIWLMSEDLGGLGARDNTMVTKEYFNWHPFLMSTAFLLLMAPAIIAFEMYPMARHTNKNIHALLMTLALISAFAGLAIILDCHNNLSIAGSFKTLHGCVGLFTVIILALNYLGGLVMYICKLGGTLRGTLKPLHKRLGLFCILMGFSTICIGIQEKADKGGLEGTALEFTYAIGIFVYAALGSTVFTVAKFVDKADAPVIAKEVKNITNKGLTVDMSSNNVDQTTPLIQKA